MDLRKLKTLIDLVAESGVSELEVTEGEDKVAHGCCGIVDGTIIIVRTAS